MLNYNLTAQDVSNIRETLVLEFERAKFLSGQSVMLGLVPFPDGDQWCVRYGDDIMNGIAGFGNTPEEASWDFDKRWYENNLGKEK